MSTGRMPWRCDAVGSVENAVIPAVLPESFEVAEEERAVLHDRPAEHGAVLVAAQRRLLSVRRHEVGRSR